MNKPAALIVIVAFSSLLAAQQRSAPQVEWPYYGGDPGGTRFSPLTDVGRDNLSRLYALLGVPRPAALDEPISRGSATAVSEGAIRRAA